MNTSKSQLARQPKERLVDFGSPAVTEVAILQPADWDYAESASQRLFSQNTELERADNFSRAPCRPISTAALPELDSE